MKMPAVKYARTFPRAGRLLKVMFLSLLLWVCVLGLPYFLFMMFFGNAGDNQKWWAVAALVALVLGVLLRLIIYALSTKIRCPLCQGATFQTASCRMNQNARKAPLLSYSTSMVLDMFIYRRFVCKYCGTPFRLRK
jgi:hypothetical protein